jgi:hypothetical protein
MFAELETYQKRYGDCDVPSQWEQNPKLANWLQQQRQERRKGKLSVAREALLDALGFEWSRRKTNRDSSGSSCRPLQHTTKGHQQESHRRSRDLNRSATNIPSACRITNITNKDAMILPDGANLGRMEFSERTAIRRYRK